MNENHASPVLAGWDEPKGSLVDEAVVDEHDGVTPVSLVGLVIQDEQPPDLNVDA